MDITIESGIRLMRLGALESIQIQDVEVNLVHSSITVSASDHHICLMGLRLSLGNISPRVARLLASIADALENSAATPVSTSAATTSDPTSDVVDGLRTTAAAVVRLSFELSMTRSTPGSLYNLMHRYCQSS